VWWIDEHGPVGSPAPLTVAAHSHCSAPNSPRLQALPSEFCPVMEGSTVRTAQNSDRRQYRRLRWSHSPLVLPHTARLQALASDFWPVLGGSIVSTGQNSDRKVWASGWWCQGGRGCSDWSGTKFSPDPQKSRFEPIFAIGRRFCPVLFVSPRGSVVDR